MINPTEEQFAEWMQRYYPPPEPQPSRQRRLAELAQQEALLADLAQTQDPENAAIMQRMAPQPQEMQPMNTIRSSSGRTISLPSIQEQGGMSLNDLLNKTGASINDKVILSDRGEGYRTPYGSVAGLDSNGRMWEMDKPQKPTVTTKQMKEYFEMLKAQKEAQGGDAKPQFHDGQWVYPPSADNPQGQSVPISGFKTKPTEDQGKTAYNVSRILQSAKMLQDAVTKNPSAIAPGDAEAVASVTPLWGSAQEGLKNLARDKDRQVVYQSQADIIDSLLFLATGAAYNKEQLEQQRASYQPNWTDKPEAINAKNERMKGLIESAKVRAGSAWTPEMDSALSVLNIPAIGGGTKAPAPAAPTRGMIKGGYLYKGGDPSKPESWMKVK